MNAGARIPERAVAGYTLIELLVVMAVLGVLAMASFPLADMAIQRDKERELRRALWEIRDAIDAYKRAVDSGRIVDVPEGTGYPPTLQALVDGMPEARGTGKVAHFLRRIPRDPFAEPGAPGWGVRSFQSPADRPAPGRDVYDVFSLSARTGLNGVPLRQW